MLIWGRWLVCIIGVSVRLLTVGRAGAFANQTVGDW